METVEDIAKSIRSHRVNELRDYIKNNAIGRSKVIINKIDQPLWIINNENLGGYSVITDITGAPSSTITGHRTTLTKDGHSIFKNTRLGEILIKNHSGVHSYVAPKGEIKCEIFSRAILKIKMQTGNLSDSPTNLQVESMPKIFDNIENHLTIGLRGRFVD